jgi:hypothetical protein
MVTASQARNSNMPQSRVIPFRVDGTRSYEFISTRHLVLKRALPPRWRGWIAVLAKTPEEFEARLPALYLDIAHDGIILYNPNGYAAQKLARIRQLR